MFHCVLYAPYAAESFYEQIFRTLLLLLRNISYPAVAVCIGDIMVCLVKSGTLVVLFYQNTVPPKFPHDW